MKFIYQKPCAAWAEQLAASQNDLTEGERVLLDQHVVSCPACAAARATYQQMDSDLVAMPPIEPYSIYAGQLPERGNSLASSGRGNAKLAPARTVERFGETSMPGTKQTQAANDLQERVPAARRVRFQRALTTFAAALVVCSLIGSAMLLLFSRHINPNVGPVSHARPLAEPPALYAALSNGTVYALRPDSGAIFWQRQLDLGGQGVIGGPTVAHGVVYVGSFNGSLYALRASDGTLLWQRALGAAPVHPIAGDDEQVIYVGAKAALYALRTSDGSVLWQRTGGTSGALNTAVPVAAAGERVYGYDLTGLFALDAADGHVLWQGEAFNGVAFVAIGEKIFATVGTGEQIEVLRASDGQVLHMLAVQGNLGFDQGRLYVANQESRKLFILRPADESITGQVIMTCPVSISPAPLIVQNKLVYTYSGGQSSKQAWVCAMNAGNGKQVWRWTETHRVADITSPVAANHHFYFLYTDGDFAQVELYALNTSNGAKLWKYAFPSSLPYGGYFTIEGE